MGVTDGMEKKLSLPVRKCSLKVNNDNKRTTFMDVVLEFLLLILSRTVTIILHKKWSFWIWSRLLKKPLMENFIFYAMSTNLVKKAFYLNNVNLSYYCRLLLGNHFFIRKLLAGILAKLLNKIFQKFSKIFAI